MHIENAGKWGDKRGPGPPDNAPLATGPMTLANLEHPIVSQIGEAGVTLLILKDVLHSKTTKHEVQ
jgi:hypothetical protein